MRLIDADELTELLNWTFAKPPFSRKTVQKIIDMARTIDAVPVKHGRWIKDRLVATSGGTYGIRRCSVCEWYFEDLPYEFKHCPRCGARMDEVTDETD